MYNRHGVSSPVQVVSLDISNEQGRIDSFSTLSYIHKYIQTHTYTQNDIKYENNTNDSDEEDEL